MDEHEEDNLCQELDDFSAAKRRDVNILLLSPYRKVRIVVFLLFMSFCFSSVFLLFMASALHVWAKNQRGKLSPKFTLQPSDSVAKSLSPPFGKMPNFEPTQCTLQLNYLLRIN